jgi:hypothetical protein
MDRYRLCKPEQARLVYSAPSWLVVPEGALNRSRQNLINKTTMKKRSCAG